MGIEFIINAPKASWKNRYAKSLILELKWQVVPRSPQITVNGLRALASICCGELNKIPLVLLPLESSTESETNYLTPNSLNPTHCSVYTPGKTGCMANLIDVGDLKIEDKLQLQKQRAEAFQLLHKTFYLDKFTRFWKALSTVDKLEVGDVLFLPDRTRKFAYPCLGRVTELKNANALVTSLKVIIREKFTECGSQHHWLLDLLSINT